MISDFVLHGKENAVSKAYLSRMTGLDERAVRSELKKINEQIVEAEGVAIVSTASQKGYWKTNDLSELEAYEREQIHRAVSIIMNLAPVRELINKIKESDQVKLEG